MTCGTHNGYDLANTHVIAEPRLYDRSDLEVMNGILKTFLTHPDERMYTAIMKFLLNLTDSEYGYFGYADDNGDIIPSFVKRDKIDLDNPVSIPRLKIGTWTGICGRSLVERKTLYDNDVTDLPPDHLLIKKVICVPITFAGDIIGQIVVANKQGDYNEDDRKYLEMISQYIAPILNSRLQAERNDRKRKQAEEALKDERKRLYSVLDGLPAYVYLQSPDYTIRFANQQFIQMFGEPGDRLCHQLIHGDDRPCDDCKTFRVFETREPQMWYLSYKQRVYQVYDYPFYDLDGTLLVLELGIDVTDMKRVENALLKSEERHREISETVSDYAYSFFVLPGGEKKLEWCNRDIREITGYSLEEYGVKNGLAGIVYPDDAHLIEERTRKLNLGIPTVSEFRIIKKDRSIRWMRTYDRSVLDEATGKVMRIFGAAKDITEKKEASEKIRESLREKEMLLKEVHHRVKNNMQVISSLINLQSTYVEDSYTRDILRDSQNRIKSMALIHEKLYQSDSMSNIDFSDYIKNLAFYLFQSYNVNRSNISLQMEIEDIGIGIYNALPCGLLLNEILTNSLKYAFPGKERGTIKIVITRDNDTGLYVMDVSDDGAGLPDRIDFYNPRTLGMDLISTLTSQINGKVELKTAPGKGTRYTIKFSGSNKNERML